MLILDEYYYKFMFFTIWWRRSFTVVSPSTYINLPKDWGQKKMLGWPPGLSERWESTNSETIEPCVATSYQTVELCVESARLEVSHPEWISGYEPWLTSYEPWDHQIVPSTKRENTVVSWLRPAFTIGHNSLQPAFGWLSNCDFWDDLTLLTPKRMFQAPGNNVQSPNFGSFQSYLLKMVISFTLACGYSDSSGLLLVTSSLCLASSSLLTCPNGYFPWLDTWKGDQQKPSEADKNEALLLTSATSATSASPCSWDTAALQRAPTNLLLCLHGW